MSRWIHHRFNQLLAMELLLSGLWLPREDAASVFRFAKPESREECSLEESQSFAVWQLAPFIIMAELVDLVQGMGYPFNNPPTTPDERIVTEIHRITGIYKEKLLVVAAGARDIHLAHFRAAAWVEADAKAREFARWIPLQALTSLQFSPLSSSSATSSSAFSCSSPTPSSHPLHPRPLCHHRPHLRPQPGVCHQVPPARLQRPPRADAGACHRCSPTKRAELDRATLKKRKAAARSAVAGYAAQAGVSHRDIPKQKAWKVDDKFDYDAFKTVVYAYGN